MNTFKQNSFNNLIGTQEDIELLAKRNKAKVLVVADSHGNYENLKSIVMNFGKECNAMIFCGDGIEDVFRLVEIADFVPSVLGVVEGNNDPDIYLANGEQYHIPLNSSFTVAGHNVFFTHGHRFSLYEGLDSIKEVASSIECSTILFGHTHVGFSAVTSGNFFVINPGSCSLPRQNQPSAFAIIEFNKNQEQKDAVFYQINSFEFKPFIPKTILF